MKTLKLLIILNISYIIAGCEVLTPPDKVREYSMFFMPQFIFEAIEIPANMQQSADSVVEMAVDYLNLCNDMEQYVEYFTFPKYDSLKSIPGPPWIKKWYTSGGVEITVSLMVDKIVTPNKEIHYVSVWDVYYSGTDSMSGVYYDNWKFLQATMGDGENTYIVIYEENASAIAREVTWTGISEHENLYTLGSYEGDLPTEWIIINTGTENSLEIRRHETVSIIWRHVPVEYLVTWNPDGSGEWKRYEALIEIEAGSWQ